MERLCRQRWYKYRCDFPLLVPLLSTHYLLLSSFFDNMKLTIALSVLLAVSTVASPAQLKRGGQLLAVGQHCSQSVDCTSQYCGHGRCKEKTANGVACYKDNGCLGGHCFANTTCAIAGQKTLSNGYHCTNSTMCASGFCDHSKCDDKKPDGSKCYKHQGCISNQCENRRCKAASTTSLPSSISTVTSVSTSTQTSLTSSSSSSAPSSSATQIVFSTADKQKFIDLGFTPESLDEIASQGLPLSTQEANDAALAKLLGVDASQARKKMSSLMTYNNSTVSGSQISLDQRGIFSCSNPITCDNPTQAPGGIVTNGCGPIDSPNFTILLNIVGSIFYDACTNHDICFGTCGSDYDACNSEFYKDAFYACISPTLVAQVTAICATTGLGVLPCILEFESLCVLDAAPFYPSFVEVFGCSAYESSQEGACVCPPDDDNSNNNNGNDPGSSDPGSSDPGNTDPGSTDPGSSDPGSSDPGSSDPGSSDPGSSDRTGAQAIAQHAVRPPKLIDLLNDSLVLTLSNCTEQFTDRHAIADAAYDFFDHRLVVSAIFVGANACNPPLEFLRLCFLFLAEEFMIDQHALHHEESLVLSNCLERRVFGFGDERVTHRGVVVVDVIVPQPLFHWKAEICRLGF
ncbi:hypothetical protein U1Q18_044805 [Sarracenia purpurea var. burkii]